MRHTTYPESYLLWEKLDVKYRELAFHVAAQGILPSTERMLCKKLPEVTELINKILKEIHR